MATVETNSKPVHPAIKIVRTVYLALLWLFAVGIVVQVLLIGLGWFHQAEYLAAHAGFGWPLAHMLGPLTFLVGLFTLMGRNRLITHTITFVLAFIVPLLAGAAKTNTLVAAFHPIAAVSLFVITLIHAWDVRHIAPWIFGTGTPTTGPATRTT